jgi:hypothetical protein
MSLKSKSDTSVDFAYHAISDITGHSTLTTLYPPKAMTFQFSGPRQRLYLIEAD